MDGTVLWAPFLTTPHSSPPRLGRAVAGARVYVTMFPCNECAKLMIQVGGKAGGRAGGGRAPAVLSICKW